MQSKLYFFAGNLIYYDDKARRQFIVGFDKAPPHCLNNDQTTGSIYFINQSSISSFAGG